MRGPASSSPGSSGFQMLKITEMSTDLMKCLIIDDDRVSQKSLEKLAMEPGFLEVAGTMSDPVEAFSYLDQNPVDLIFLDVEMPEMSGLELAETLPKDQMVIFVSGKEDYALKAFDLNVVDYLLKPVSRPRFLKAVQKARKLFQASRSPQEAPEKIYVKVESQLVGISLDQISHIEALADYVKIHTDNKRYTVYSSMKGIESRLPAESFMRVHRSYIVNLKMISTLEDNTIYVNGHSIPVGGTYQKKLLSRLNLL